MLSSRAHFIETPVFCLTFVGLSLCRKKASSQEARSSVYGIRQKGLKCVDNHPYSIS